MDTWLDDAKMLGFQVPRVSPLQTLDKKPLSAPVVIVGAGPSGLAVAAALNRRKISNIVLESQEDPTQFGSWDQHFSNLEVTSQAKWCQLPNFPIHKCEEWKGEYITAQEYRHYLHLYAARFGIEILRGVQVVSIEKGHDPQKSWTLETRPSLCIRTKASVTSSETTTRLSASAVIVAIGKHRVPFRNTSDNLVERLEHAKIPSCHTADLRDDSTWNQAIQAARTGRLAIVGFGNSAADIATAILRQCPQNPGAKNTFTPRVHIAARTVPPVFPRQKSVFRVDTIGWFVRLLTYIQIGSWWSLEDFIVKLLWWVLPSSRTCNLAFPPHLPRWVRIQGRVPVIDKYGILASGFASGQLVGHGPVLQVLHGDGASSLSFDDGNQCCIPVPIEMVILATGYRTIDVSSGIATRHEDRLNGLYHCGLGNDRFLPLHSIGEEALGIAHKIASGFRPTS